MVPKALLAKLVARKPARPPAPADPANPPAATPTQPEPAAAKEIGGPDGPEPTRYSDWERNGRCIDF